MQFYNLIAAFRGAYRKRKTTERSPGKPLLADGVTAVERSSGSALRFEDTLSDMDRYDSATLCASKTELANIFTAAATPGSSAHASVMNNEFHLDPYEASVDLPDTNEAELPFNDHPYCMPRLRLASRTNIAPEVGNGPMPDTRTKGRKYAMADTDYGGIVDEMNDDQLLSIVVQMSVPGSAIPSRLIIPMVRVPRSAVLLEEERSQMDATLAGSTERTVHFSISCCLLYIAW